MASSLQCDSQYIPDLSSVPDSTLFVPDEFTSAPGISPFIPDESPIVPDEFTSAPGILPFIPDEFPIVPDLSIPDASSVFIPDELLAVPDKFTNAPSIFIPDESPIVPDTSSVVPDDTAVPDGSLFVPDEYPRINTRPNDSLLFDPSSHEPKALRATHVERGHNMLVFDDKLIDLIIRGGKRSMVKEKSDFAFPSQHQSSVKSSTKSERTTTVSTSKQRYVLHLPDSFDLENLRGTPQ